MEIDDFQLQKCCRACKNTGEDLQDVFSFVQSESEIRVKFSDMIMECTSIRVLTGDGLPSLICAKCIAQLEIAYKFKKQCEVVDNTFRTILNLHLPPPDPPNLNLFPNVPMPEIATPPKKKKKRATNKLYRCKICDQVLTRMEHTRRHMMVHLKTKPFHCKVCKRGFNKGDNLRIHEDRCTGQRPWICTKCNRGFAREDSLQVHMQFAHEGGESDVKLVLDSLDNIEDYVSIEEIDKNFQGSINFVEVTYDEEDDTPLSELKFGDNTTIKQEIKEEEHEAYAAKKSQRKSWTEEDMQQGLKLIKEGKTQHYVEEKLGISRRSLARRLKTEDISGESASDWDETGGGFDNFDRDSVSSSPEPNEATNQTPQATKKQWTEDDMQKALKLIKEGKSQRWIEEKYGISRSTIKRRIKIENKSQDLSGDETDMGESSTKQQWTEEDMSKALEMIKEGKSQRIVSDSCNVPRRTLRRRLEKEKIKCEFSDGDDTDIGFGDMDPDKLYPPMMDDISTNFIPQKASREYKEEEEEYLPPNEKLPCSQCFKKFATKLDLKIHMQTHSSPKDGNKDPNKQFKCTKCDKTFRKSNALKRHFMSIHSEIKPYSCHICAKKFTRKDHMNRHIVVQHDNPPSHKCSECEQVFTRIDTLNKHKYEYHGIGHKPGVPEKKFPCEICKKLFTTPKYKDLHKRIHEEGWKLKKYACKACEFNFENKEELARHLKVTNDCSKRFLCAECGQRFTKRDYLEVHIRRHRGEKPFKCSFCGKGFPRTTDLKAHEKCHTGEKTHLCIVCGKGFGRAYKLTLHMRTHTGEKPYQCQYCEAAFAQSNDLKAHTRRHTGERYYCDVCNEGFVMGYMLTQHKRLAHGLDLPESQKAFARLNQSAPQPIKPEIRHPVALPKLNGNNPPPQHTTSGTAPLMLTKVNVAPPPPPPPVAAVQNMSNIPLGFPMSNGTPGPSIANIANMAFHDFLGIARNTQADHFKKNPGNMGDSGGIQN